MSELWRRLLHLVRRRRFDRDLEDEIAFHLEMKARENREAGLDAEEAHFAARRQLGNVTAVKERSREMWGWLSLERLVQDLRYALRMMRRSPGLTIAATLSLALGIGADTALFSAMDALWFRPLAVRDASGLVRVFTRTERYPRGDMSYADYLDIANAKAFAGLAASQSRGPVLGVGGVDESAWTEIVSENYFTVLGVQAAMGRMFREEPQAEQVLVISHNLWQRRFGSDPNVVGRTVELNGRPFVVIGVAPKEFRGLELWSNMDLWLPMNAWPWSRSEQRDRRTRQFTVIGRLRPGVTLEQARAEVSSIARGLAAAYPKTNKGSDATVLSALQYQFAEGGTEAAVLASIMAILLLIACANVANLLLARGEARRRELAVRLAIGCSRGRLVRQLFTESFVLALAGAAAALLLAAWLIRLMPALLPDPNLQCRLDHRVLAFALAATVITAVLFGLAPALRASRPDLAPVLKNEPWRGRLRAFSVRDGLVVTQMALSLVLLAGAGLLVRSFLACLRLDLGFARRNMLIVRLYPDLPEAQARVFYDQLLQRVRAFGGVRQAGLVRRAPLWPSEGGMTIGVNVPGHQPPDDQDSFALKFTTAGDNYFRTMGIPVLRGRDFDDRDNAAGLPVAIINETMARRFWPGQDPIGRIIVTGKDERRQIVGVVKDVKINWILESPEPYLYLPFGQDFSYTMSLLVETSGDPLALANPIRSEIRALARMPLQVGREIATLASLVRDSTSLRESIAFEVSGLGVIGILLTAAGLYGVMSFVVARRTQEIGIRMALGASRRDALILVLRRALAIAGCGAAIGLAGALALSRMLSSMLFGVGPRDPLALGSACLMLLGVAVLAAMAPAVRASKTNPMEALRYE